MNFQFGIKHALLLTTAFSLLIVLESYDDGPAKHGARATNAPGDGPNKCTSCHTGGSYGSVTVDLFVLSAAGDTITEYKPDSTYQAIARVNHSAGTPPRFGFQMIALKNSNDGNYNGWSNPSANSRLSTSNARNYVEHNAPSSTNIFSVDWKAPAEGTGTVDFYLAGNAVNNNNSSTGDNAGYGFLSLTEYIIPDTTPPALVKEYAFENAHTVYPNPASKIIRIKGGCSGQFSILDQQGNLVKQGPMLNNSIEISDLEAGCYYLILEERTQKFIKF